MALRFAAGLLGRHVGRRAEDGAVGRKVESRSSYQRARPKSIMTSSAPGLIMMLAGFRSRWMIPSRWASEGSSQLPHQQSDLTLGQGLVAAQEGGQGSALNVGHCQVGDAVDLAAAPTASRLTIVGTQTKETHGHRPVGFEVLRRQGVTRSSRSSWDFSRASLTARETSCNAPCAWDPWRHRRCCGRSSCRPAS